MATKEQIQATERAKSVPISTVLAHFGIHADSNKNTLIQCPNPLHQDDTPSFSINVRLNTCHCFGSCGWANGKNHGDSIDLYKMLSGTTDHITAVNELLGLNGEQPIAMPKKAQKEASPLKPLPFTMLEESLRNQDKAIDFFKTRGIGEKLVKQLKLGALLRAPFWTVHLNGVEIEKIPTWRITIPYFSMQPTPILFGMAMRRYDKYHKEEIKACLSSDEATKLSEALLHLYAERTANNEGYTMQNTLDTLYGPRYITNGSKPFYLRALIAYQKDGKWIYPARKNVFITEGEIDAISILQAGYYAVSTKGIGVQKEMMERLFQNVENVCYLADNDQAGATIANNVKILLDKIQIITPPSDYKDANEMLVAGDLASWLESVTKVKPGEFAIK